MHGLPRPFPGQLCVAVELEIEDKDAVRTALELFRKSDADFSDALIVTRNRRRGIERTGTFDETAARLEGFEAL